jgi:hypothetical protein
LSQKTKRDLDFVKPFKITSQTAKPTEKVVAPDVKDWRDLQITDKSGSFLVYLDVYGYFRLYTPYTIIYMYVVSRTATSKIYALIFTYFGSHGRFDGG